MNTTDIFLENKEPVWSAFEKWAFRVSFIFFFLLIVPLELDYYKGWFTTDWANLHIRDIGRLSGSSFNPIKIKPLFDGAADKGSLKDANTSFLTITAKEGIYGLASYINWFLALGIGIIGAFIWGFLDQKRKHYRNLYYFLLVGVSYAMLIKLQGLTFSKVFPTQMPDLALTQLNTPFGDFTAQKLYWIQFSFVHGYEVFAGLAELLIMLFLLFKPTRAVGAALSLAMIGNITFANHAYDGGIHLAAAFFTLGGAFVLWPYLKNIWTLLVLQKDVKPNLYYHDFKTPLQKYFRITFKSFVFLFFFVLSAYLHWHNYKYDSYKVPSRPGLADSRGLYDVTEFKVNNKIVPYSPVDSVRWQNVTFEKWSTMSYTVFNTFLIHGEAGRGKQFKDIDRTYESAGTGGGRRHFYYEADTIKKTITFQSKNKVYKDENFTLHYQRPSANRIILWGKNQYKDSIYVVLDKRDKVYPLYAGRKENLVVTP
ncbi:hypothetical protein PBAC_00710 [Pedobacter glucosidilyticus]|nr:hypothetical protein [Pedobacter glucosidilyticus]KHJ39561.1 hypothetical protein PBAC_00710 [Pedobacter glucosidilyticus]